jgi:hypothetical protein
MRAIRTNRQTPAASRSMSRFRLFDFHQACMMMADAQPFRVTATVPLFAVGTVGLVPVDRTNRWADGFRAVVIARRREARCRRLTPPPDACTYATAILLAKQDYWLVNYY